VIAVDTNILIYAHRQEFAQHARALKALSSLAEGGELWSIPAVCLAEFLRITTHPAILKPPSTIDQASRSVDALLASPSLRLLLPGDRHAVLLLQLVREQQITGNLVFDAQIVALCLEHGVGEILTEDRDFGRFPRISARLLPA
jgi:toxin-antitoxin system PIN domain toxin